MLGSLLQAGACFLVVGAHAMAVHGVPRATGDRDIWIDTAPANIERVWKALRYFGAPVDALSLSRGTLAVLGTVIQIGLPPKRIDLLTEISGVGFQSAWESRVVHKVGALQVPFIGRAMLVQNKSAAARSKDLADLETLEQREK